MSRRAQQQQQPPPANGNVTGPQSTLSPEALSAAMTISPSLVMQFTKFGGNLTPQSVSAILAMADIGRISRLVDLTHELRQKDGHMHACLQASEVAIGRLDWTITPPQNPTRKELKCVEFCRNVLQRNPFMSALIEHHAGEGRLFGHSTSEVIWKVDSGMIPVVFKNLSCRRFGFKMSDGELAFDPRGVLEADVNAAAVDLIAEYPLGKFLQFRPRVNGDVPAREGLARFLIWLAMCRNWGLRDWMEYAELSWKPKRSVKVTRLASQDDVTIAVKALERIIHGNVGVIPETVSVELAWANKGSTKSDHKEMLVWVANEISKGVLGSTDIVEPAENGSRGAVETRNELRIDIRNSLAANIAAQVLQPLVVAMTRLNFGEKIRCGVISFITEEPADIVAFSGAVKDLHDAGVRLLESWVHEKIGMPSPGKDDLLVGDKLDADGNPVREDTDDNDSEDEEDDAEAEGSSADGGDGESAGDDDGANGDGGGD